MLYSLSALLVSFLYILTGTCYDVDIVNSTEEIIEVPSLSSVCFHCKFKDDKSEDGDTRWQIGALILQSGILNFILNFHNDPMTL